MHNPESKNNFFIITGGPGSGKTTLISAIEGTGLICIPEVARIIIKEQMDSGGKSLPWDDLVAYSELMMERSVKDFEENISRKETLFFDRGIPDTIGYMKLVGITVSQEFIHLAENLRYNSDVFIMPPWKEIYQTDLERKQSFQEAKETYEALFKTYQELKYNPIVLEKTSVESRVEFILSKI